MKDFKLTPKQLEIVEAAGDELLIRGIAGSGKTVVLLRKAVKMAIEEPMKRFAIITFNNTLKKSAEQQVEDFHLNNLEVLTFHSLAIRVLNKIPKIGKYNINTKSTEVLKQAIANVDNKNKHRLFADEEKINFVIDEISWIKGMGGLNREEYLKVNRTGRGTSIRVSKDDRNRVYDVLEEYKMLLGRQKDFDDCAPDLFNCMSLVPENMRFDTIFIDEAQDLQMMQLKVLRCLTRERYIVAADKGQKIYKTSFTWKDVGLNILGGRTKILNETFRSTKQIVQLASCLQINDSISKDEEFTTTLLPVVEGPVPRWYQCSNQQTQDLAISKQIKVWSENKEITIGLLSKEWRSLYRLKYQLNNHGILHEFIKQNEGNTHKPGVKLTTFHSAKGLEFDYVLIADMTLGKWRDSEDEDEKDINRRLLYVSMTRAKSHLVIYSYGDYPEILNELNSELVNIENI